MNLTVVGLGPGGGEDLTLRAVRALEECDLLVGYGPYLALLGEEFAHKEKLATGMRREVERCRAAVEAAMDGKRVAVVCSGDPGVYGMAGLLYEVAREYGGGSITVIPGVTAACSGAALLGAPLGADFAVISLSDLLTPWGEIEKRLEAAAGAGLVICLYNPASRGRPDHLRRACELLLRRLPGETVCGMAKNIGRPGESCRLLTLEELRQAEADMTTTVFVGSPRTLRLGDKMVTPRGYRREG